MNEPVYFLNQSLSMFELEIFEDFLCRYKCWASTVEAGTSTYINNSMSSPTYIQWQNTHGIVLLWNNTFIVNSVRCQVHNNHRFLHWTQTCGRCTWSSSGRCTPETDSWVSTARTGWPVRAYHRVDPVLLVSLSEWNHLDPECQKCSIKKSIHKEHLTWKKCWNNRW